MVFVNAAKKSDYWKLLGYKCNIHIQQTEFFSMVPRMVAYIHQSSR